MDYNAAFHRLLTLVDHERGGVDPRSPVKFDLGRMEAFLRAMGDPQHNVPAVHVAGTKGKGSTAAMVASVLTCQGYTTGLYSSPHLHTFRERIAVNSLAVCEEEFAALVEAIWPHIEGMDQAGGPGSVSLFEALTAMAFLHFKGIGAQFQVLEVGLGGRLDATNVVLPRVCAITSLSLDHTAILGDTVERIAAEKAGIIKPGTVVVSAPQPPGAREVIRAVCSEKKARLTEVGQDIQGWQGEADLAGQFVGVQGRLGAYNLWIPLLGAFQVENVATAVGLLEVLREQGVEISVQAMEKGFRQVRWPCRMEVLQRQPLVVCDGAHNPYSAAKLAESLPRYFKYRRVILIIGASVDKDLNGIVEALTPLSPLVIATTSRHPRSTALLRLVEAWAPSGVEVVETEDVKEAVTRAKELAGEGDLILATGSLFVAAEVREAFLGIEPELYPELEKRHPSPAPPRTER